MALHAPFDWESIFVVDLAGNPEIFTFLAMIAISYAMSKFNFSNKVVLTFYVLFTVIMSTYMIPMYVLIILVVGLVTYYSLSKLAR